MKNRGEDTPPPASRKADGQQTAGGSGSAAQRVLLVVTEMITAGGTEVVQLAEVAQQARVSLTTIYKHFASRDELILAAVESWMDEQVYRPLAESQPDLPLFDALTQQFRHIFEPWQRNPRMAEAFMRARFGPGGDRLQIQGFTAVKPVTLGLLRDVDPGRAEDIRLILNHVVYAIIIRFAAGELAVCDIMPVIDRTLRRLADGA